MIKRLKDLKIQRLIFLIFLIFQFFNTDSIAQTDNHKSVERGTTTYLEWQTAGDYTGYDSLYFVVKPCTANTCARLIQKPTTVSYTEPYSTLTCTLYVDETASFNAARYYYSIYAYGSDTAWVTSGNFNLMLNGQTPTDGVPTVTPYYTVALDTPQHEPTFISGLNSTNVWRQRTKAQMRDDLDISDDTTEVDANFDSLYTKTSHIVNVKEFGAVGDGVTDDTDALQDMLDYCELNSGTVIHSDPDDNYKITRTLFYEGGNGSNFTWLSDAGRPRADDKAVIKWYGHPQGTAIVLLGANESVMDGINFTATNYTDTTAIGSLNTAIHLLATNADTTNTVNVVSLTLTSNVATIVCDAPHKFRDSVGTYEMTVKGVAELSGLSDSQYDGKYLVKSIIDANTFTINYVGADDAATGGTCTKVKSVGSSHVRIKNSIINWLTGYKSAGIKFGRAYPSSEQVSEVELHNILVQGAADSPTLIYRTFAAVVQENGGNTKNFRFTTVVGSYLEYLFYMPVQSGRSVFDDCGGGTVSEVFYRIADGENIILNTGIENADSASLIYATMGVANLASLTMMNTSFVGYLRSGVGITYPGKMTLINNAFSNSNADSGTFKIILYPLRSDENNTRNIVSMNNTYVGDTLDYLPLYFNDSLYTFDYLSNAGINVVSINDLGTSGYPGFIKYRLKNLYSIDELRSNAVNPSSEGVLRLGKDDDIMWRNDANTDNVGITKDTTDKFFIGDLNGIQVGKVTATALPADTSGLTPQDWYYDLNTGQIYTGLPLNLVTGGEFSDWDGVGKNANPVGWSRTGLSTLDTLDSYVEQSPIGQLHYVYTASEDSALHIYDDAEGDSGVTYGYSFEVKSVTGLATVRAAGEAVNDGGVLSVGFYSGEVTPSNSTNNEFAGISTFSDTSTCDLTIDNFRVWQKIGGLKQPPIFSYQSPINLLNPTTSDTVGTGRFETLGYVDSIFIYDILDSVAIQLFYRVDGDADYNLITIPDTLTTTTTIVFDVTDIPVNARVYMYPIFIGDSEAYIRSELYWRKQ